MHNNYLVTLENVTFGYEDEKPILQDVSVRIPSGQIIAIMGGSGCGKTTLLRLITGQEKPWSGKVKLFGQDIDLLSNNQILQLRQRLGVLFQFGALFTDMSVYDNVAFPLQEHTNLPTTIIDKIIAMKLKSVGLFGTQEMFPQELSGGMARRVAMARAMALDPELMLYDEPFTGLDPISLQVSALLIKQFSTTLKQTAVLVTHDIKTTLEIADRIYFMERGKIIAEGTPDEIKKTTNPAVKQFIEGSIVGPFKYEFDSKLNYEQHLEA